MNFKKELKAAKEIAVEAGNLIKKLSFAKSEINYKGEIDLVTNADLGAEKLIISALTKQFPEHKIISEEDESKIGSRSLQTSANGGLKTAVTSQNDYLWLIDPLDGTTNFAHRFPMYAVSIALVYRGEVVVGVVYAPIMNELFTASKGAGAFLNGESISVSKTDDLNKSLLATGFPYSLRENPRAILAYFNAFALKSQGVRRPGAASIDLCYVACGRFDGFWEVDLKPWDTAAASIVVTEAGGKLSKFDGSSFDVFSAETLATNGYIHEAMMEVLATAY